MKFVFFVVLAFLILSVTVSAQECKEGERRVCGSDIGVCESGRSTCRDGKWDECTGSKGPESDTEICYNGLDDDCNGQADENCFPWIAFLLIGIGLLFLCLGLHYMNKGKDGKIISESLAKD
jgi:tellurite resistance protein TehA-like permease